MSDKPTLQIAEHEGNRFTVTETDGKTQTYIPSSKTLWFEATEIQVVHSVREQFSEGEFHQDQCFSSVLSGTAELESTLEVVGDPRTKTKTVDFSLSVPGPNELFVRAANLGKPDEVLPPVALGYLTSDWEVGIQAQWYLHIDITAEQLEQLLDAYRSGTIKRLSLGVRVSPVFMFDSYEYSPVAERVPLFLRPDKTDINGRLISLSYSNPRVQVKTVEPTEPEPDESPLVQQVFNPEGERDKLLTTKLEQLKASVTFVGWAIVALALVMAFK